MRGSCWNDAGKHKSNVSFRTGRKFKPASVALKTARTRPPPPSRCAPPRPPPRGRPLRVRRNCRLPSSSSRHSRAAEPDSRAAQRRAAAPRIPPSATGRPSPAQCRFPISPRAATGNRRRFVRAPFRRCGPALLRWNNAGRRREPIFAAAAPARCARRAEKPTSRKPEARAYSAASKPAAGSQLAITSVVSAAEPLSRNTPFCQTPSCGVGFKRHRLDRIEQPALADFRLPITAGFAARRPSPV